MTLPPDAAQRVEFATLGPLLGEHGGEDSAVGAAVDDVQDQVARRAGVQGFDGSQTTFSRLLQRPKPAYFQGKRYAR
ncbi:hypothetical protein ACGFRG_24115 [Streptomyces sp. NPDC048696]|uniref:hypothetical protein n=1 Tax=Streptomyces sp. NPDC048696 TaxID=3365585 RepID=UPI0037134169